MSEEAKGGERLRVSTADGKYTVIQGENGGMRSLRHGEPWPAADENFAHVGMILALAQDLEEARAEREKLQESLADERELYRRETRVKATLRDQFAMAALGGVVGRDWFDGSDKDTVWAAKTAYLLADAMMAERAKGRTTP